MSRLFFLFSLVFIFAGFQCNDCESTLHDSTPFVLNVENFQDQYTVGDSITFNASFNSDILLTRTETEYDNNNDYFKLRLSFNELKQDLIHARDASENFDVVGIDGIFSTRTPYFEENFAHGISNQCLDATCLLEFEIIPKIRGVYLISYNSGSFAHSNECASLSFSPMTFNIANNNAQILEGFNIEHVHSGKSSPFDIPDNNDLRYFFFEVKE